VMSHFSGISNHIQFLGNLEVLIRIVSPDHKEHFHDVRRLRELVYVNEQRRLIRDAAVRNDFYEKFESQSIYFIAYADGDPVGTLKVISDSSIGLPCERESNLANLRRPGNKLVEFGNFISVPKFRSRGLGFLLLKEALGFSVVCLQATHILADIFIDDATSLGARYFLERGFTQVGEVYSDERFNDCPQSMVVVLDVKEGARRRERALAIEDFRRRYLNVTSKWNLHGGFDSLPSKIHQ
jgi:GNAT superfamily N-acetyltransferase